jgi:hypothetical protein
MSTLRTERDQLADQELAPLLDGGGRQIPNGRLLEELIDSVGDRRNLWLEDADATGRLPLVRDGGGGRPVARFRPRRMVSPPIEPWIQMGH